MAWEVLLNVVGILLVHYCGRRRRLPHWKRTVRRA